MPVSEPQAQYGKEGKEEFYVTDVIPELQGQQKGNDLCVLPEFVLRTVDNVDLTSAFSDTEKLFLYCQACEHHILSCLSGREYYLAKPLL